jgi:uridylate kinase
LALAPVYKRVLIKLSGEVLAAGQGFGINQARTREIAEELDDLHRLSVEVAVVIGGGNFIRGSQESAGNIERVAADHMGMLATVINALALQDALEKQGCFTRVMTAIEMNQVAEPFIRRRAIRHLEKGRVVIFGAGTGSPFFSTDTAASLRAMEIKADVILKATKVDGLYDADPAKVKDAQLVPEISYSDVLVRNLGVMDFTAISMCRDYKLPIIVFNLNVRGNMRKIALGEKVGSLVHSGLSPADAGHSRVEVPQTVGQQAN